jgi:hypothetical protein
MYQSLIGLVVICCELGMEDHGSIPHNCDWEGLEPLNFITYPRTKLNWWRNLKKKTILCDLIVSLYAILIIVFT